MPIKFPSWRFFKSKKSMRDLWQERGNDYRTATEMDSGRIRLLTDWERWEKNRVISWTLILHLIALILTTFQAVQYNIQDSDYVRAQRLNWLKYFYPADPNLGPDETFDPNGGQPFLYSIDKTVNAVRNSVSNYDNIKNISVTKYYQRRNHKGQVSPILTYTLYDVEEKILFDPIADPKITTTTRSVSVNKSFLGPLDDSIHSEEEIRTFFHLLKEMNLHFSLNSIFFGELYRSCIEWDVKMYFISESGGPLRLKSESNAVAGCLSEGEPNFPIDIHKKHFWYVWVLDSIILLLAIGYQRYLIKDMIYQVHEVTDRANWYNAQLHGSDAIRFPLINTVSEKKSLISESKSITAKIKIKSKYFYKYVYPVLSHNYFFAISFSNICFIVITIKFLIQGNKSLFLFSVADRFFLGLGCFLSWCSILRWLQHNPSYFVIMRTLSIGVPRVFYFTIGALPIMIGYAIFGIIYFANTSNRFGNLKITMITLFSMTNGDIIRETFQNIMDAGSFIVQIYLYSFISLFIYVVLSVFIVIMELAYEELHPMEGVEWNEHDSNENNQNHFEPSEAIVHSNVLMRSSSQGRSSSDHNQQHDFNPLVLSSPTTFPNLMEAGNVEQQSKSLEPSFDKPTLTAKNSADSDNMKFKDQLRLILNTSHCSFIEDVLKCIPETQKIDTNSSGSINDVIMSQFKACQTKEYINMKKEMLGIIFSHYRQ